MSAEDRPLNTDRPSEGAPPEENEQIPGTVHLVDLLGTMHAQHAKGSQRDIVLVPAPSPDPDDPLNWSPARKALSTACMCIYTFVVGLTSAAIYSVFAPISEETSLTLDDLNRGTGYMFLFFGWGCLIWQPLALQYGKRPVYLLSILITIATQIWAPHTRTNGHWIANKIVQGFAGAPIESLCEISITDIYFTHERGRYIALYALLLAGSSFFAPIISGFISDGQGWQWVLYWCAIFNGIGFVFLFFFMEETNYVRHHGGVVPLTSDLKTPLRSDKTENIAPGASESGVSQNHTYKLKSYWDKINLVQRSDLQKPNELRGMATRPLIFLTFPVIFYAGFSYGSNLVWFNVLNATASLILAGKYGFSASMVGLSYVSALLGVVVAAAYTGWVGDWFVIRKARKNSGIMESEHRLWMFVPSLVLVPFGLILWGVGSANNVHWFGPVFAMGVISATNTFGLQLSVSYCIDSYRALSGEAIITVILVRNTMSFAIGYGITPWVTNMGLQNCFITAAFVGLAQVATIFIMIKWGKTLRRRSIPRYSRYVTEMEKSGMVH
ncbi:MFS transporter [Aaosphaeria arxii CBS 175.79]|uniref:MFS transporter n=1 Tax=Aaosphaeria arxii CBS 175.79 TaxID=1450172 RepID=A0A6A5XPC8_9PLEO|nr:MFS transporter [Aaosphaeria arxii CBS 175.79]KAF2014697.1 MFS transporter [Aaosphaeria arxii CBS 175.79]